MTPLVNKKVGKDWEDVAGAAANVPGVSWTNNGPGDVEIAFTDAVPDPDSPTDAIHLLQPGVGWDDPAGSAHVFARCTGSIGARLGASAE